MSDEHHIHSQLKHVLVNNWNYTEYILRKSIPNILSIGSYLLTYLQRWRSFCIFKYIYKSKLLSNGIKLHEIHSLIVLMVKIGKKKEYFFSDIFQPIKRKLYECPLHGWSFSKLSFYCT
jgi:hypothetical protein